MHHQGVLRSFAALLFISLFVKESAAFFVALNVTTINVVYGTSQTVLVNGSAVFVFSASNFQIVTIDICSDQSATVYLSNVTVVDDGKPVPIDPFALDYGIAHAPTQSWSLSPLTTSVEGGSVWYVLGVEIDIPSYLTITLGSTATPGTTAPPLSPVDVVVTGSYEVLLSSGSWLNETIDVLVCSTSAQTTENICSIYASCTSVNFTLGGANDTIFLLVEDLDVNTSYSISIIVQQLAMPVAQAPISAKTKPIPFCWVVNPSNNPFCSPFNPLLDPNVFNDSFTSANSTLFTPYSNLTFFSVYAGPTGLAASDLDSQAFGYYQQFLQALTQYPCIQFPYSYVRTCNDCLAAYALWLCDKYMPHCTDTVQEDVANIVSFYNNSNYNYVAQPCIQRCWDTTTACPFQMGFTCPGNSSEYTYSCPSLASSLHPSMLVLSLMLILMLMLALSVSL